MHYKDKKMPATYGIIPKKIFSVTLTLDDVTLIMEFSSAPHQLRKIDIASEHR